MGHPLGRCLAPLASLLTQRSLAPNPLLLLQSLILPPLLAPHQIRLPR